MQRAFIVVIFTLLGCGKEPIAVTPAPEAPRGPAPTVPVDPASMPAETVPCPIPVSSTGLCTQLTWDATITAGQKGEFHFEVWSSQDASRGAVFPEQTVSSYFVMKCCKSVTQVPLERTATGYRATGVKLRPGEYWHFFKVGATKVALPDIVVP